MHLSYLSGAAVSDLFDDSGRRALDGRDGLARQHLDGLVRGLVFASALMAPFALTFAPAAFGLPHPSPAGLEVRP